MHHSLLEKKFPENPMASPNDSWTDFQDNICLKKIPGIKWNEFIINAKIRQRDQQPLINKVIQKM